MGRLTDLGAVVLCGGQSSRMKFPKAMLPFGNKRMLTHITDLIRVEIEHITVVAYPDQTLPELNHEIQVVHDTVAFQGPLSGILSGFQTSGQPDWLFVTATDAPLLKLDLVSYLFEIAQQSDYDVVMPFDGKYHYPLTAIYKRRPVLQKVEELLNEQRYRPVFLLESLSHQLISVDDLRGVDPNLDSFKNINSRNEYRTLLKSNHLEIPAEFQAPNIRIEFYGITRLLTKTSITTIQADNTTELIEIMAQTYPDLIGTVIVKQRLHPAFRLVRNTTDFIENDDSVTLNEGDTIMVINADAGG